MDVITEAFVHMAHGRLGPLAIHVFQQGNSCTEMTPFIYWHALWFDVRINIPYESSL